MSSSRGEGPLTTDDGWWQKADGTWHPPSTHPFRDVPGFLEELPEPPPPEVLAEHEVAAEETSPVVAAQVGSRPEVIDLRDEPAEVAAEEPDTTNAPAMSRRAARIAALAGASQAEPVSVVEAPIEPEIERGPAPAERLQKAVEDTENIIVLPEVERPPQVVEAGDLTFKSEVVEVQPTSRRRKRQAAMNAGVVPQADDGPVKFGSEVVDPSNQPRRQRRR